MLVDHYLSMLPLIQACGLIFIVALKHYMLDLFTLEDGWQLDDLLGPDLGSWLLFENICHNSRSCDETFSSVSFVQRILSTFVVSVAWLIEVNMDGPVCL